MAPSYILVAMIYLGQDFYNWVTFQDPVKLRQLLDLRFGFESRVKDLQSNYVRLYVEPLQQRVSTNF